MAAEAAAVDSPFSILDWMMMLTVVCDSSVEESLALCLVVGVPVLVEPPVVDDCPRKLRALSHLQACLHRLFR